ncbi:hypothetical protein SAMN04487944_1218 [Gracilibacillus ureilyticus]|uniref:FtsX-like permease family protein n=1 Tax=Gracilibacillus ureilyticus TaxID=531814 RepID=A0A1H9V3G9_9BACI|nr:hypothetical protein [Gracilibacillus ureilyticus]SES15914.1 hypothetical protein SAMN04487944_1218 [Gracilibacillus ureilyticus]
MIISNMLVRFLFLLSIPVLAVLYAGLLVSALISVIAGLLRTFGFEQIKMSLWQGMDLPAALSIPLSLAVAAILVTGSFFVGRSIRYCVRKLAR